VADGRVYVPTETGDLFVLKHEAKPFAHDAEDERATGTDAADAADAADANREGMKAAQPADGGERGAVRGDGNHPVRHRYQTGVAKVGCV
jgi:hypothetical protein